MGFRVQSKNKSETAPFESTDANVGAISGSAPLESTDPNPNGAKPLSAMPDLGILNGAISDPDVTEIMVNDLRNIAIEKRGQIIVTPIRFKSLDELNRVVQTLTAPSGKQITHDHPLCVTSLPDGSRVHIAAPPVTDFGPCITIRRFPKRLTLANLVQAQALDSSMAQFLNACILGRQNILISGGTGTGKTSLMNALISLTPPHERVVTIEDTAEIPYLLPNQVKLMAQPSTSGGHTITPRELVTNALRMRPDRIIVGECRGPEALDMIQAMNTGHQGSMTTIHANSPRDALFRLETLTLSAGLEMPISVVRRQIVSAIQLIVQIRRFKSGARKIVSIQEITGMEADTLLLQEIFSFVPENENDTQSDQGTFQYHLSSKIVDELKRQGIKTAL